jgi:hypothetical protein
MSVTEALPAAESATTGADWLPLAHSQCPICVPPGDGPRAVCGAEILGIPVGNNDHEYCGACERIFPDHIADHFRGDGE